MTEDGISEMPLPEDWGAEGGGESHFLNPNYSTSIWMDQFRSSIANHFENCLCSCGEVYDPNLDNYYPYGTDNNQSEDPRLKWKMEQEEMIKEYLSMAYEDLMQKKEMCGVKEERLRIAREELNAKLEALNRARITSGDANSSLAISNGGDGQGRIVRHSPEELKVDVDIVKQRIKKLVLELAKMRSSVIMSERGIDALTMVNRMISDRGRGEMEPSEAGEMVRGIRGMDASIKAGEQRRWELMKSVADLSQQFLAAGPNTDIMSSDASLACVDTASQTELSGDMSKRFGTIAKLKLNHDQNKKYIMEILEELIEVENQLIPCAIQFDANRVLLIQEKDKLLQELKRQQCPESEERIRDLEEDLYKVREIFRRDVQLDNERLNLTKKKVMLEEELLERARLGANLELHIRSLHRSMNSISSGSSLGSLGSLSASSKGSQNSIALHDLYSMQELNKSLHQVNLSDLHSRVENIFQDQLPPPSRSLSALAGRTHPNGSSACAAPPTYLADDGNAQSLGEMARPHQSFQQYPTVQEEIEDGDEGFEGLVEDEEVAGNATSGTYSGLDNARKLPPSYEDHLQLTGNVPKVQQPFNTCLYQQAPQPQICQRLNGASSDAFSGRYCQSRSYPVGKSYCLYEQPCQQYGMCSSISQRAQKAQVHQRQDLYQQQFTASSDKFPTPQTPLANTSNYPSDHPYAVGMNATYNNISYPNNLLTSNSLPSLFNTSSMYPMTNCGSESQIFRPGTVEGSAFHLPVTQVRNGRDHSVELTDVANYHLKTDKLPTVSRSLLREFGVDNKNKIFQHPDNQVIRNLQHQQQQMYSANNICLKRTPLVNSMESSFAISMPTCHTVPPMDAFSPKSSSTSHLHGLNGGILNTERIQPPFVRSQNVTGNGSHKNSFLSNLSLSSSSLLEDGSNLGSDSGVFESANRLNNVLSAQIHVQVMYDYCKQEILVCIERVRNLSAVSIHNLNEVVCKVHILPSTTSCGSYVEDTDPSSPHHFLPSHSNLGKIFHFPVESEKVLSKTIQVFILRLNDSNSLNQRSQSRLESVGMSLISLASFDLKTCLSSWYNIISFQCMDAEANKCLPPLVSSITKNETLNSIPSFGGLEDEKITRECKSVAVLKEESSGDSTATSSQTSTLTRVDDGKVDELDATKNNPEGAELQTQDSEHETGPSKYPKGVPSAINSIEEESAAPKICHKETNTDSQKAVQHDHPAASFLRRPITPGSKLNKDTAIRRWQTFSPVVEPLEGEDHAHKLNRSGSDSSVRRKNSHFDRHAINRQSIRVKMPSLVTKKPEGILDLSKNQTSIDLMLDFQSYKTKLEMLNKEIIALQTIKQKLEEAKERGETEPLWLQKNEELQALLQETSGTFREKALDRKKLSDITDLANRKIRKVKIEMLSLQARKSIIDIDRMVFKKKMSYFTSPDDNLSFLDQVETEIDDPIGKDMEDGNPGCSRTPESMVKGRNVPLSIRPSDPPSSSDANNFENMLF